MPESDLHTENTLYVVVCSFVFVIVLMQSLALPKNDRSPSAIMDGDPCQGDPIAVEYNYSQGAESPHECAEQCRLNTPHYILYADGTASQCELLPACNDWGEDRGVFCIPQE
ncbi:hypothetical protein COU78_06185 [Candidatus Peregrinibacteria bacterium CG10_big_fil_rev_8_21_14_0_10_49_24]|nr:MAG: hypothetical protein COV83_03020 [Candidatus Peregrinibacteria bacterium CG11_big_fil_rev_8_21_14_0_20_49_14]PIR50444.1 MAG: hypothetical protein COU78_06185 [Candidatus Peregrinibacteria bacterium CG10_big_fil_rev_8_21_14_0_10_49_24]PJA68280.1 MAG: hypothetical protein CO157_00175 [Candidatus Peregrinibacteria bacterium CG_4_9_14_3_um_filter_49_12]